MEIRIYLFLALLVVIFFLALILYHVYDVLDDQSSRTGAAAILSSATICFRSSLLSIITLLTIFFFSPVKTDVQKFAINLMIWQTIFALIIVLVFVLYAIFTMKKNSSIDYQKVKKMLFFAVGVNAATLISLSLYHIIYGGKMKSINKNELDNDDIQYPGLCRCSDVGDSDNNDLDEDGDSGGDGRGSQSADDQYGAAVDDSSDPSDGDLDVEEE